MSKFSKSIFIGLVLSLTTAFSSVASAACTRADLTGVWQIYTTFDTTSHCTLTMPSSGTAIAKGSSCNLIGLGNFVLSGNLSLAKDCHLSGKFLIHSRTLQVDAWINRSKDTMAGREWDIEDNITYDGKGDIFTGIKQ